MKILKNQMEILKLKNIRTELNSVHGFNSSLNTQTQTQKDRGLVGQVQRATSRDVIVELL